MKNWQHISDLLKLTNIFFTPALFGFSRLVFGKSIINNNSQRIILMDLAILSVLLLLLLDRLSFINSCPIGNPAIVKKRCLREWTLFLHFLILLNLSIWFRIPLVCETLLRCKYRFSSIVLRSIPVVAIWREENEIYQLDSRIETDNIRCFILLSGLRNCKLNLFYNAMNWNFRIIVILLDRIILKHVLKSCKLSLEDFSN